MAMTVRSLAISFLLAMALYYTYGQFSLSWMAVLPIVFALSISSLPESRFSIRRIEFGSLALILFFFVVAAVSLLPASGVLRSVIVDVSDPSYLPWMRTCLLIASAFAVGTFLKRNDERKSFWLFFCAVVFATAAAAQIIPTSPHADIDVWTLHEQAADAFSHFKNPYTVDYINIYPEQLRAALTPFGVNYAYLPGVFIWMAPWSAVGLDTRYSQVFAFALTSILLYLIARRVHGAKDFLRYVPALLFLSFPLTTFFIVRAWNDDISVLFFALAAYAMVSRRPALLFLACNALLLSKQYSILFVPFFVWFAVRSLNQKPVKAVLASTLGAALVISAYLLADWRNFLGSLYGLHFLKHPEVHQVFPDRTDAYSLMNWLHVYTGLKSSWFFTIPVLIIAGFVIRKNWHRPSVPSLLRGTAAMSFGLFIFAPIAFANYYEFGFGLMLIAMASSLGETGDVWEIKTNWWVIGWVATRSLVLFVFSNLIIETRFFSSIADLVDSGQIPYVDFNFHALPFALIPAVGPTWLRELGDKSDFLSYHWLFQIVMLACDALIATFVFSRFRRRLISRRAVAIFVFGPLLIAPIYFTSATLASIVGVGCFAWLTLRSQLAREALQRLSEKRRQTVGIGSILVLAGLVIAGLLAWIYDLEVDVDALLLPTHVLIVLIIGLSVFDVSKSRLFGVVFLASLFATGIIFLRIESVFNQDSPMALFVWIRNSLAAFSVILLGWGAYHSKPGSAENEV